MSCRKPSDGSADRIPIPDNTTFNPVFDVNNLDTSDLFNQGITIGSVDFLNEASGLGGSHYNAGMIWSHNDGGNGNDLYLIDENTGTLVAKYSLEQAMNIDWEDLSLSYNSDFSYTYIADIGDNFRIRSNYSLYCFEEPIYDSSNASQLMINPRRINFIYPDGTNNAEAVMVDNQTGDLLIATKGSAFSGIYRATAEQLANATGVIELEKLGTLPIRNVTAGDISIDGNWIALKTYDDILFWNRVEGETIEEMFSRVPEKLPYNKSETQGEAFCWTENGYYTLSENVQGVVPELYFYSIK